MLWGGNGVGVHGDDVGIEIGSPEGAVLELMWMFGKA